jgi:hypothetical protein
MPLSSIAPDASNGVGRTGYTPLTFMEPLPLLFPLQLSLI